MGVGGVWAVGAPPNLCTCTAACRRNLHDQISPNLLALCIRRTLSRHVTIDAATVILLFLLSFDCLWYTVGTQMVQSW